MYISRPWWSSRGASCHREPAQSEDTRGSPMLAAAFPGDTGSSETRERIEIVWSPRHHFHGCLWGSRIPQGRGPGFSRRPPLKRPAHPSDWPAALSGGGRHNPGTGGPWGGTGRGVGTCVQTLPKPPPAPKWLLFRRPPALASARPPAEPRVRTSGARPHTCRQWPCPALGTASLQPRLADPTFPGRGPWRPEGLGPSV